MAVNNGTMDLLAKKMLRMVGKNTWCIPLLLSAMTFLLAAAGCGNIPTFSIILPLGIALAVELGIPLYSFQERPFGRTQTVPLGTLFHVTAGNVDGLPAFSAVEGLLTGNINLVKLPSGDQGLSLAVFSC